MNINNTRQHGMDFMIRLTYVSTAAENLNAEALVSILESARQNNLENGITGMLIFNKNYFLQTLEGSRAAINSLIQKINSDARHTDLQVIEVKEINERLWSEWSMDYATPTIKNRAEFLRFSPSAIFNPYQMNSSSIHKMLIRLSEINTKNQDNSSKI